MPSLSSSPSNERIEKSKRRKEGDAITVVEANDATQADLAKNTKELSKQNKKWKKGFGSTSAASPDGTIDITTTGLKLEKENMEVTFGATNVSEQKKPGEIPRQDVLPGVSLNWKF